MSLSKELADAVAKSFDVKPGVDRTKIDTMGNEMSEAIHFEAIAIKHWGKDNVWICDNHQEVLVG